MFALEFECRPLLRKPDHTLKGDTGSGLTPLQGRHRTPPHPEGRGRCTAGVDTALGFHRAPPFPADLRTGPVTAGRGATWRPGQAWRSHTQVDMLTGGPGWPVGDAVLGMS